MRCLKALGGWAEVRVREENHRTEVESRGRHGELNLRSEKYRSPLWLESLEIIIMGTYLILTQVSPGEAVIGSASGQPGDGYAG